jgi:signal transduction histidine kinase
MFASTGLPASAGWFATIRASRSRAATRRYRPRVGATTYFGWLSGAAGDHTLGGMTRHTVPDPAAGRRGGWRDRRREVAIFAGFGLALSVLVSATYVGEIVGGGGPGTALLVLDFVAGVVGSASLPLLVRAPVPTALALAVLAAFAPTATPPATVGTLQVARTRRFPIALGVAAVGVGAHLIRGGWRSLNGLPYGWYVVLVLAVHAALLGWGSLAQARRALLASYAERARRAEADAAHHLFEARLVERTRIAREMHDVLGHRLSLLATYAGALEFRPDAPADQLSRAAGVVRAGARQALEELREIIGVLRDDPDTDLEMGRPMPTLGDLPRLVAESRDAGLAVEVDDRVSTAATAPPTTGRTAYRLVQEGLTNARKHGLQPARLMIAGGPGAGLEIELRNPLRPEPAAPSPDGTGLIGLAERVQLAGGQFEHGVVAGAAGAGGVAAGGVAAGGVAAGGAVRPGGVAAGAVAAGGVAAGGVAAGGVAAGGAVRPGAAGGGGLAAPGGVVPWAEFRLYARLPWPAGEPVDSLVAGSAGDMAGGLAGGSAGGSAVGSGGGSGGGSGEDAAGAAVATGDRAAAGVPDVLPGEPTARKTSSRATSSTRG